MGGEVILPLLHDAYLPLERSDRAFQRHGGNSPIPLSCHVSGIRVVYTPLNGRAVFPSTLAKSFLFQSPGTSKSRFGLFLESCLPLEWLRLGIPTTRGKFPRTPKLPRLGNTRRMHTAKRQSRFSLNFGEAFLNLKT